MAKTIVALSGWKGSGKDTAADYLVNHRNFTKLSFAARLKDMVATAYSIPREWLDQRDKKDMPLTQYPVINTDNFTGILQGLLYRELESGFWTPRALCILEGSAKRSVHSNYWVQSVIREILESDHDRFVISDLRYRSEADTLGLFLPAPTIDLKLVRVNRYAMIDTQDPSERDLDDYKFMYEINNEGSKEHLYEIMDIITRFINVKSRVLNPLSLVTSEPRGSDAHVSSNVRQGEG